MSHLIVGDNCEAKFIKKEPFETCFVVEPRFAVANFTKNVTRNEISTCHLCKKAEKLLRALYKHIQANHPDDGSETMKICSEHCAVGKMIQAEIVDHLMSLYISCETSSTTLETCEECTRPSTTEINELATSLCPGGMKHQRSLFIHFKTDHIADFKLYNEQSTAMTRCFCSDGLIIQTDLINHLLAHLVGINEVDWIKQEEKCIEDFEGDIEKIPIATLKRSHSDASSIQSFGNDWQEDQDVIDNDDFLLEENVKKRRRLSDETRVIVNSKLNEETKLSAEVRRIVNRCDLRSSKSKPSHSGDNDCKLENGEIHCLLCSYYCLTRKLFQNHWDNMHAPNILSSCDNRANENTQLYKEVSVMAKNHPGDNDFTRENMKLQCNLCSYHCWNKKYYRKHWNATHDPNNPNKRVPEEVKDHPGDKDYRRDKQKVLCLLCPYQCYNKKYYREHWDAVHRSNVSSSQDDSQIADEIKDEQCNTDQEYQEQNEEKITSTSKMAKYHPGDKDYRREHMRLECLLCNYHCWNKKYYRRHWNAMHDPNNPASQAQSQEGNEQLRQERDEAQNKSLSEKLKNHPGDNDYIRENMRLECLLCNYHCWNKQNYRKHWDSTHDPNSSVSQSRFRIQLRSEKHPGDNDYEREKEKQKLQCKLCSWCCYNKMRYRIHWESAHDPLNPNRRPQKNTKLQQRDHPAYNFCEHQDDRYYCLMCNFIVKTRAEYRDHWEAEHDESSSTLQKNDKSESHPGDDEFEINDTIEIDLPSMSENLSQKLSCDLCGFQSYTLDIMNYHIHQKHSNVKSPKEKEDRSVVDFLFHKNEDNQYVCDYSECGRTYINKNKLRVHQRVVHSKVMCDKCSKWVIARSLSIHFQINHGAEKSIKCDFKGCKASFVRKSDYLAHMSSKHEGKKLFKCEQCEKEFSHKASLNSHVTYTHVNPEKLRCQICQLKLSTLQGFRLHMRTHTDDNRLRPFACDHPQCDKSFKYSDHLAQHRRVCHTENGRLKKKANAVSFMKNHPNYSREYYENKKYKAKN